MGAIYSGHSLLLNGGSVPFTKRGVLGLLLRRGGAYFSFLTMPMLSSSLCFFWMSGGEIKHHPISSFIKSILDPLPGANSLPLQIDGWKLEYYPFLLGFFLFSGAKCEFYIPQFLERCLEPHKHHVASVQGCHKASGTFWDKDTPPIFSETSWMYTPEN